MFSAILVVVSLVFIDVGVVVDGIVVDGTVVVVLVFSAVEEADAGGVITTSKY